MHFTDVSREIGADPSRFSRAQMTKNFRYYVGGDMVTANVDSFMELKRKGYRWAGGMKIGAIVASEVTNHRNALGLEVRVTVCQDQTQMSLVDESGAAVTARTVPAYNVRLYIVRKPAKESTWRVYGMRTLSASAAKPSECAS